MNSQNQLVTSPFNGTSMLLRVIIVLIVWWYALGVSITYGSIWDSKAFPTPNVEVSLDGGTKLFGSLHREWDKSWVVTSGEGIQTRFFTYQGMWFKAPSDANKGRDYLEKWRLILPVVIVCAGASLLMWGATRSKPGEKQL